MTEDSRTPACTTLALKALGGPIREALRTRNFLAAEAHARDVITELNHESAWCYDTDRDLPHITAYFATLHDTCARLRHTDLPTQKQGAAELLETVETVLRRMSELMAELVEERAPDAHLGIDEIEHRGRRYADPEKAAPALKVFD